MSAVKIYTDGSCLFPSGPGGFSFIVTPFEDVVISDKTITFTGGCPATTNNRMELQAVLEALQWVKENGRTNVLIYSDSQYVVKGSNQWMHKWVKSKWKNGAVKNLDQWKQIYGLYCETKCRLEWVRGHNGNCFNELCDGLANKATNQFKEQKTVYYNQLELGRTVVSWINIEKGNGGGYTIATKFSVTQIYPTNATVVLKPVNGGKPVIMSQKDFDSRKFILL